MGHGGGDIGHGEELGGKAIVEVGRVVGHLVGEVDQLRLQGRPLTG